jgi:pre-mRNA-processing factor 40
MGGADPSSSAPASQPNGTKRAEQPRSRSSHSALFHWHHSSILPARPNLPDDPVIPHNGFLTVEEGEKAFTHLLRKAGVDANWTWDQTMRAIITDPLYKALNTLAEKKACWEKVRAIGLTLHALLNIISAIFFSSRQV